MPNTSLPLSSKAAPDEVAKSISFIAKLLPALFSRLRLTGTDAVSTAEPSTRRTDESVSVVVARGGALWMVRRSAPSTQCPARSDIDWWPKTHGDLDGAPPSAKFAKKPLLAMRHPATTGTILAHPSPRTRLAPPPPSCRPSGVTAPTTASRSQHLRAWRLGFSPCARESALLPLARYSASACAPKRLPARCPPCPWSPPSPRRSSTSNSHGARPVHPIITMIKWIRTSRLSIKNSLSRCLRPAGITRVG